MTISRKEREELIFSRLVKADVISSFTGSIGEEVREQFARLLEWAFGIQQQYGLEQKVVRGYTDHPPGYNRIPMLVFAELGNAGRAQAGSWMVRIPLRSDENYPLTVVLPTRLRSDRVNQEDIAKGKGDNFRPLDLDQFLSNPSRYVRLSGT